MIGKTKQTDGDGGPSLNPLLQGSPKAPEVPISPASNIGDCDDDDDDDDEDDDRGDGGPALRPPPDGLFKDLKDTSAWPVIMAIETMMMIVGMVVLLCLHLSLRATPPVQ